MSFMSQFMFIGAILIVLDTITWGVFPYVFFRLIGVPKKRWYFDYSIVVLLYLAVDLWSSALWAQMDITIGNPELLEWLEGDANSLESFGWSDVLITAIQIRVGYWLGSLFYDRFPKRVAGFEPPTTSD